VYRWCLFVLRQDQSAEALKIYTGPGLLHVILDDVPRSRWPPFIRPPKGGIPTLVLLPLPGQPAPTQLPMKTGGACKAYLHHLQQLHLAEINRPVRPKTPPTVLPPFPDTPRTVAQRLATTTTTPPQEPTMHQQQQPAFTKQPRVPGGEGMPFHASGPSRPAHMPGRLPATPATPAPFLQTPVEVPLEHPQPDEYEPAEPEHEEPEETHTTYQEPYIEPDQDRHEDRHEEPSVSPHDGLVDMTQRLAEIHESLMLRGTSTPKAHGYGVPASDLQVAAMDIGEALERVAKQVHARPQIQEMAEITSQIAHVLPTVEPMASPDPVHTNAAAAPASLVLGISVQVPPDDDIPDLQVLQVPVEEPPSVTAPTKRKSSRKAPAAPKAPAAAAPAKTTRSRRSHANEQPLVLDAGAGCTTDAQGNAQ
jgi:hypothetical protein